MTSPNNEESARTDLSKLDEPLRRWYLDPARSDTASVRVLVRFRTGRHDVVSAEIERTGGTVRSTNTLVRSISARIGGEALRELLAHPDVVGLEMVHRSSSWHTSPWAATGGTDATE